MNTVSYNSLRSLGAFVAGLLIGAVVAAAVGLFLLRPWQDSGHSRSPTAPAKDEQTLRLRQENIRLVAEQQRLRQTVSELNRLAAAPAPTNRTLPALAPVGQPVGPDALANSVMAASLYWFANYIEWPPAAFLKAGTPLVVAVLGEDRFGKTLEANLQGKMAKGRLIRIVRAATVDELPDCHILLISDSEQQRLDQIFAALRGRTVVTVGTTTDFIQRGGLINFIRLENKIGFQINPNRPEWPQIPDTLLKLSISR